MGVPSSNTLKRFLRRSFKATKTLVFCRKTIRFQQKLGYPSIIGNRMGLD